jgi:hypothetical protein
VSALNRYKGCYFQKEIIHLVKSVNKEVFICFGMIMITANNDNDMLKLCFDMEIIFPCFNCDAVDRMKSCSMFLPIC